ncbi:hypothetical protein QZM81_37335 [Burkholderia cepacia]|uniref:hypothetical protein n=1 Tax=Burkholderia cepacia TaxID=292 RepID=UPI0026525B2A|nr:hypothetical protein [Burkholderia cepacia]MDN7861489.1 hypothetical protein [Burkholderia cepacia]
MHQYERERAAGKAGRQDGAHRGRACARRAIPSPSVQMLQLVRIARDMDRDDLSVLDLSNTCPSRSVVMDGYCCEQRNRAEKIKKLTRYKLAYAPE